MAGLLEEAPLFQAKEDESFHPRPCRKVVAQEWGASGIVSNDEVKFLPHVDEFVRVEPAIFCDEALPSKEEKHFLTVSEIDDLDSSLGLPSIPSNPESEKEGSNIDELPTGPVTKQYESSPSNDTSIPDVFTDAQLRRAKRKRWIRMKKLIRLARKIETKMHN